MKKAIFLDRDGTIIEDKDYLGDIKDVILLKNAIEGLKLLQENNYLLFIVSNQSGVARGYFSEKSVIKVNEYLKELLLKSGVMIEQMYYCPHHKDGIIDKYKVDCDCRKPKIGMIKKALDKYDINLKHSFVLGDKISDMKLAKNCNCDSILILTGYGKKELKKSFDLNLKTTNDLLGAAKIILKSSKK